MTTHANILPTEIAGHPREATYWGDHRFSQDGVAWLKQQIFRSLGAGTQNPAYGGGGMYQVQSLDRMLRHLTFSNRSFVAWRRVEKQEANSTFHSFRFVRDWGGEGGGFVNAGETPALQSTPLGEAGVFIKYLATQREVEHPLMVVKPAFEDPVTMQSRFGSMWMIEQIERSMFNGNSRVVPQEWDGYLAQLFADPNFATRNVLDMRGQELTENHVEYGVNVVIEENGVPDELYMTPHIVSRITQNYYNRQRYGGGAQNQMIGFQASGQYTSGGEIEFCPDIHIRPGRRGGRKGPPTSATHPLAPPPPTSLAGSTPGTISGDPSLFDASSVGTYTYWATAVNRFGESAPTVITAALTFTAGQSSTISIVSGGGTTTGYVLYRGQRGSTSVTTAQVVRRLALGESFLEQNHMLPGHGFALMMQKDITNKYFAVLCPMIRVPLSRNALSYRFALVFYGHPVIPSPQKNFIFMNLPDSDTLAIY